jgi:hypothetical protein
MVVPKPIEVHCSRTYQILQTVFLDGDLNRP